VSYVSQPGPAAEVDRIEAVLRDRPELLARLRAGDTSAVVELIEVGTGAEVRAAEVRLLA